MLSAAMARLFLCAVVLQPVSRRCFQMRKMQFVYDGCRDTMTSSVSTTTKAPLVAIVGRPNVGKSTLFNRLIGSRRAIVGDEPGITRDRLYGETSWTGRRLRMVDTGGIVPDDKDIIPAEILRQARVALEESAAIVMVVDVRTELAAPDYELAQLLRRVG